MRVGPRSVLIAIAAVAGCWGVVRMAGATAPRLVAATTRHDFGEVKSGERLRYTFPIRNVGYRRLEITGIKANCSCTGAVIEPDGDDVRLKMDLALPQYRADIEGVVTLETNEPGGGGHTFALRARSTPILEMNPRGVDFGQVDRETAGSARLEFDLTCQAGIGEALAVRVDDLAVPPTVSAELIRGDGPNADRDRRMIVGLRPDAPAGPLTATILLTLASGEIKPIEMTVRGSVVGPVRADPPELFFATLDPSGPTTREARIAPRVAGTAVAPRVAGLLGDLEGRADVDLVRRDGADVLRVAIRKPGAGRSGRFRGVVRLEIGDVAGTRVNVPVIWYHGS